MIITCALVLKDKVGYFLWCRTDLLKAILEVKSTTLKLCEVYTISYCTVNQVQERVKQLNYCLKK